MTVTATARGTGASVEAPPNGGHAVRVEQVRLCYGSHEALAGVDLEVPFAQVTALLGPNGAGKTSLLEILEGHRRQTSGSVKVLGVDPSRSGLAWRARLGIVLQETWDHADWRVETLVRETARCYPRARGVKETLDLVGLGDRGDALVRNLSGGQRRRLDVGLGIVGRPELLFLDEPTTGFDPEARRAFWDLIERLAVEGVTVLLTTHYLEEAERLAQRIAILCAGRILASDTTEALAERAKAASEVRWTEDGAERRERTNAPEELVWQLSQRFAGPIPGLEVHRPTLEDTYLAMIKEAGGAEAIINEAAGAEAMIKEAAGAEEDRGTTKEGI